MLYCVNGELVPASEATVSVQDRGFKYGDAVFETLRAYDGQPFEWDRHVARLHRSCELLGFEPGYSDEFLHSKTLETLAANDLSEAYIRLSVTRGIHSGKLSPPSDPEQTLVIIVSELPRGGTEGHPVWDGPASVEIVDTARVADDAIPAAAKTHNYLNGILARCESGADETVMTDANGRLSEGATSNLIFSRDGRLHTPTLDGPVLPGITRAVVKELAAQLGIEIEVGSYTPADLRAADGACLTNTTWEIRPIEKVDGTHLGNCEQIEALRTAFDEYVESTHYDSPDS
ncbi:aminotransferase class IV [Halomicroarcula sp. F28]|uniref:Aminotransferase class IV n=2 Tax=Haloarcula salinisoli TaxID=2487746 RepID=A0A8J7YLP8_9EURY|nr:aminotransferase class IV [Halomicroarcula salinisoli]MBX0306033.1 aminotransferase class IV [Halomicroarcula salinisoli]